MTRIIAAVEPVLEDLGYQEHDSTFIRSIQPDGLVHVVDFQHSRSGAGLIRDSGEFQARVLSPVCGPPFTVNLGVWLPGVSQFPPGPAQDMTGKAICAADCLIRDRIGRMLPDRPGDWWWPVSADGEAGEVIARALAGYGLPWLSRFTSWNEMLFRFETGPSVLRAAGEAARDAHAPCPRGARPGGPGLHQPAGIPDHEDAAGRAGG
jgi:hypothetical protein